MVFLAFLAILAAPAFGALSGLETPPRGVQPDSQQRVTETQLDENWQDASELRFEARRTESSLEDVWIYAYFEHALKWRYQTPPRILPKDGSWAHFSFRLGPRSADWFPAGHLRDLDDFSLAQVVAAGIHCSSSSRFPGKIEVRKVSIERRQATEGPPHVFDFLAPLEEIPAGSLAEIRFRLDRPYRNPFDPDEADIRARFLDPQQRPFELFAFYFQEYAIHTEGAARRRIPAGAGEWRIRFRPQLPGLYRYRIVISGRYSLETEEFTLRAISGLQPVQPPATTPRGGAAEMLLGQLDRCYAAAFLHTETQWQPEPSGKYTGQFPYWHAPLEWMAPRPGFLGLGFYNLENARMLDHALLAAELAGERHPLRLFPNEEFHDVSSHEDYPLRWSENPLRWKNRGPVARPSEFFSNEPSLRNLKKLLRYLHARFGCFSSFSHLLLSADFLTASGPAAWHQQVAATWSSLPAAPGLRRPALLSLHPQAASDKTRAFDAAQTFSESPPKHGEIRCFGGPEKTDWSGYDSLAVEIELPAHAPGSMRCILALQDEEDWWYHAMPQAFLRPDDVTRLEIRLDLEGDLQPAGHGRPWSPYSRMGVRRPEIRVYSPEPFEGTVTLKKIEMARTSPGPASDPSLQVLNLRIRSLKIPAGQTNEVAFELSRAYADPFDPGYVALDAEVQDPEGRKFVQPAFLYQAFGNRKWNNQDIEVPEGPLEWRIRIPTRLPGLYSLRLMLRENYGPPIELTRSAFTALPPVEAPKVAGDLSDFARQFLVTTVDRSYMALSVWENGRWVARPTLLSAGGSEPHRGRQSSGQAGIPEPISNVWLANLEWHPRWGRGYRGLGKYNLLFAYHLDQALVEADSKGLSYPLRLIGNEEFHDVSANVSFPYRWSDNPLHVANGGPLARPSLYFQDPAARQRSKAFLRYVTARFAPSQAVSALLLANEMAELGSDAWQKEIGEFLSALPQPSSGQIASFHPLAVSTEPRLHQPSLAFQEQPSYSGPSAAESPGKEVRAFSQGPGGDWSAYSMARVRFELPRESPADLRTLLCVKDEDGWWYQALHPAFLRPGDATTLLFHLLPGQGFAPVGHSRPWSNYSRFRLKDVSLRLFSAAPYAGPIRLAGFEFLETPAQPAPLKIVSFSVANDKPQVGDLFEVRFHLNQAFINPFDPNLIHLWAAIRAPSGRTRRVQAFFTQDYRAEGDRLIAEGPEYWKLRFRPQEEGSHTYRLEAQIKGQDAPLGHEGQFVAAPPPPAARARKEFDSPALLRVHDLSYLTQSQFTGGTWRVMETPADPQTPLWQVVLEWTSRWGKYADLGRYNLEAAWEFEKILEQAGVAGQAFPLRLNGNMEFYNRRNFRWPDNPLNAANGGPLQAPSFYYRDPKTFAAQEQLWRYLIARFGELPAVSDLVLAADLPAEGAEAWHARAGQALNQFLPPHASLFSFHPQVLTHQKAFVLADFERGPEGFKPEMAMAGGPDTRLSISSAWASHGSASLAIQRAFTGEGEAPLVATIDQDWFDYDTLVLDVRLPEDAPHDMRLMVFLKDGDFWYYQNLLTPFLLPGDVTRLLVDLTAENKAWQPPPASASSPSPWHHTKPWTDGARSRIRQVGLRLFGHKPYAGAIYVDNLQLWQTGRATPPGPPRVAAMTPSAQQVGVFDKFELTFSLDHDFHNPFNPDEVNITARFITPRNENRAVPAFYFQDYDRAEIIQACPEHRKQEPFEILTPKGHPVWKVRFAPTEPGTHRYSIAINGQQAWPAEGTAAFEAVASNLPGFVRLAGDQRHFEYANGNFFFPIGTNLRSPTDGRNAAAYLGKFEQEWHRNTFLYDQYFKKMQENGINWARVWQCSWWMGLEWTREWPGYHGLGRYNLENAWRMDYLLEQARKHGIYLQIDTTNHGQLSLQIDSEWAHNPINRNNPVDRGHLQLPREFFTLESARQPYAKRVRYNAARWSYSPHVFAWILMTECEFTDDYWASAAPLEEDGRHPGLVAWHAFAAGLFKSVDPNHIVATHFSHPWRGHDVFAAPAVQFVESNTYWQDWKFEQQLEGPPGNTPWVNHYAFQQFLGAHQKPVLVGEFGGNVYQNPPDQLDIELHIGAWSMLVLPYAGNTGYWWWPWMHSMDRYGSLRSIAEFMKGEDRRGKDLRPVSPAVSEGLLCLGLQNQTQADLWVYHPSVIATLQQNIPAVANAVITLPGLPDGNYDVEFWDTYAGKPVAKSALASQQGSLAIALPAIQGDLALKVRPAK